jgi:ketosteroid isomerase-like protein
MPSVKYSARDTWPVTPEESATPDLLELTRGAFEAANRGDLDSTMSFYAPDAVWEALRLGTSFKGRDAIRGFVADWMGAYEELEFVLEELRDLGRGVVFAVIRQSGRPVGTVGRIQQREGWVFVWVYDKPVRVIAYYDIDEARAAAERLAELGG